MCFSHRSPFPSSRPSFRDILTMLLEGEEKVLEIPVEDASTHKHASILGVALEAGGRMYPDLQWIYLSDPPTKGNTTSAEEARIDAINPTSQTSEHHSTANIYSTEVDYEDMSDAEEETSHKYSNITPGENDYEVCN